ncbi:peptidylprolyl isomerase [Akkermansiaceae bacterium]|nr:peptidylprolyl isomerase [Akkermansiaceae bacterium]
MEFQSHRRYVQTWNMKFLTGLIILCTAPLQAQIYADVSTTLGDFTIELYYEDSPMTVANFVGLAEGSKNWIDPATDEVKKNEPYYDGIIFHRVIEGFMNQVGSPQGTGSDGPGYNFPDEVGNNVLHDQAYLLSSANSGPNTNGSQMFITVDATPWLDGVHTVFGKVTEGTDVIDSINQVPVVSSRPVTDVSITGITIRRVGPEAIAFGVAAQGLPVVSEPSLELDVSSEGIPQLLFTQNPGTSLNFSRSPDLATWEPFSRYLSSGNASSNQLDTDEPQTREFFQNASLVTWSAEASFPSDLENFIINIDSNEGTFVIDLGDPATVDLSGIPETSSINMESSSIDSDGYGTSLFIYSDGLVPLRFRLGADLPSGSEPSGRMTGTAFTNNPTPLTGTFSLTPKP